MVPFSGLPAIVFGLSAVCPLFLSCPCFWTCSHIRTTTHASPFSGSSRTEVLNNPRACRYDLVGVVVHHGHSVSSGHYTAFVLGGTGQWLTCDDSHVASVREQVVLKQQAYLLMYARRTPRTWLHKKPVLPSLRSAEAPAPRGAEGATLRGVEALKGAAAAPRKGGAALKAGGTTGVAHGDGALAHGDGALSGKGGANGALGGGDGGSPPVAAARSGSGLIARVGAGVPGARVPVAGVSGAAVQRPVFGPEARPSLEVDASMSGTAGKTGTAGKAGTVGAAGTAGTACDAGTVKGVALRSSAAQGAPANGAAASGGAANGTVANGTVPKNGTEANGSAAPAQLVRPVRELRDGSLAQRPVTTRQHAAGYVAALICLTGHARVVRTLHEHQQRRCWCSSL